MYLHYSVKCGGDWVYVGEKVVKILEAAYLTLEFKVFGNLPSAAFKFSLLLPVPCFRNLISLYHFVNMSCVFRRTALP